MTALYWPIALTVLSNVFYHICSKGTSSTIHPLASLTVTYAVSAALSLLLYFLLNRKGNLLVEYRQLNWSSFVFGIALVGLELGSIYMYKAGWNISVGQLVCSAALSILLIFIGRFFYRETLSANKVIGIVACMIGLYFINK
jgi:drug/metabolite transporter (DMT)-like permease